MPNRPQIRLSRAPNSAEIGPHVIVRQLVAHPRDLPPRYLGIRLPDFSGKPLCRFADDLQLTDYRVLNERRGETQLVIDIGKIAPDASNRVEDVLEVNSVSRRPAGHRSRERHPTPGRANRGSATRA